MTIERIIAIAFTLSISWALNKARKSAIQLKRFKADYELKLQGTDKYAATEAGRKYYKELRGIEVATDEDIIKNEVNKMRK